MGFTLVCGVELHACNLLSFSLCQTTWKEKKGAEELGADSGGELPQPQAGAVGGRAEPPSAEAATVAAASQCEGF